MKKKSTKKKTTWLEESLVQELARAASLEGKIESQASQTTFLAVLSETKKQKLYEVMSASGMHYRALIGEFKGLEKLIEGAKGRFLDVPPFLSKGDSDMRALENQLSVEKSAKVGYENILKKLNQLGDKAKIVVNGVTVVPDKAKPIIKKLIEAEKGHIKIIEGIIRSFGTAI